MTRTSLATMLAILLALSQPAWAQGNGHGPPDGKGPETGGGHGPGGNAGENGGHGPGHDKPGAEGKPGDAPAPAEPQELSEDDALAAVAAGRAVELSTILPDVRARTGGEVINAQLQQAGQFLIYAVTVLTPSGQVLTEHYYARSGVPVGK